MKTKLFLSLTILLVISMNSVASMYDGFKGQEWKFIEYMFVKKPEKECSIGKIMLKQTSIGLFVYLSSQLVFKKIIRYYFLFSDQLFNDQYEEPSKTSVGWATLFCSAGSMIAVEKWYEYWYRNSTEYEICSNFITNWPEYKEFTPQELHSSFDAVYQKYKQKKLTSNDVYEMIAVVKELLRLRCKNSFTEKFAIINC